MLSCVPSVETVEENVLVLVGARTCTTLRSLLDTSMVMLVRSTLRHGGLGNCLGRDYRGRWFLSLSKSLGCGLCLKIQCPFKFVNPLPHPGQIGRIVRSSSQVGSVSSQRLVELVGLPVGLPKVIEKDGIGYESVGFFVLECSLVVMTKVVSS